MKDKMSDRTAYQELFDEIYISDQAVRRIKSGKKISKKAEWKKIVIIAASLVLIFMTSNVISYAAIGKTWVKTMFQSNTESSKENKIKQLQEQHSELEKKLQEEINKRSEELQNQLQEGIENRTKEEKESDATDPVSREDDSVKIKAQQMQEELNEMKNEMDQLLKEKEELQSQ